jgi:uncharacterized protein (DUF1330 family)
MIAMMERRYMLVVSLWIHPGQEAAFEAYEREAARIMARHGGRIDSAVRISPDASTGSDARPPHEVHIVSFPDQDAADSYASDPESVAMRVKRPSIIARTERLAGKLAGPYEPKKLP